MIFLSFYYHAYMLCGIKTKISMFLTGMLLFPHKLNMWKHDRARKASNLDVLSQGSGKEESKKHCAYQ